MFREATERNFCCANFNPNDSFRSIPCLANPMRAIFSLQKTRTRALTTQQEHAAKAHLTAHHTRSKECGIIGPVSITAAESHACLSLWGLKSMSCRMTTLAAVKLIPTPPAGNDYCHTGDLLQPTSVFLLIDEYHMWIYLFYVVLQVSPPIIHE
jgi:hypothetical protein